MLACGVEWGKSAYTDALISPLLRQWWLRDMWCKQSWRGSKRTHFSAAIYNVGAGNSRRHFNSACHSRSIPSFALWLRCNHGSFGRLWKWSKQAEMDGEISSVQCPESAGCTVDLIAPSYRHRSYHERMLGPMRYGQFGHAVSPGCKVWWKCIRAAIFADCESLIWISTGQVWPSWSNAGA